MATRGVRRAEGAAAYGNPEEVARNARVLDTRRAGSSSMKRDHFAHLAEDDLALGELVEDAAAISLRARERDQTAERRDLDDPAAALGPQVRG